MFFTSGQEFQAIFLSTAEPINSNGMPTNPTKSPCGQYVFNTAITRAKSLVVCFGNPFTLLRAETRLKNEQLFWKDYIRRCLIAKTFHIPSSSKATTNTSEALQILQEKVFTSDTIITSELGNGISMKDSILERLQEFVRRRPNYKRCKLQIHEQQQTDQIWKIVDARDNFTRSWHEYEISENVPKFLGKVDCELLIKTQRNAICVPLNSSEESIVINGFNNRRGAFHGDIVTVGILGKNEMTGQKYGRVTYLKEARHPTKYVCRADQQNIINFYPIDRLVPAIVNLPKISRNILQHKPEEFSESQKNYITIFEESSLNTDDDEILPQIKELIPLEMGTSLLFIVKVLSWSPRYRKPLGAVIEALPRTNNMFIMEKLLVIAHDIHHNDKIIHVPKSSDHQLTPNKSNIIYERAFTIDPPNAINLDDALCLTLDEGVFKLSVLISDVAKHIRQGSDLDKCAQHHGTSVYMYGHKCSHMLPIDFSTTKLSLVPKEYRDVLVVSASVKIDNGKVVEILENDQPENACMMSFVRLSYKDAQQIMNGEVIEAVPLREQLQEFDDGGPLSMKGTLKLLFNIAMKLCIDRLGNAAYSYDVTDPGEEENWQSHLLVSELMIWANSKIAKFLYEKIPGLCPLRRQLPPTPEDIAKVQHTHKEAFIYSLSLGTNSSMSENTDKPLLVPSSTIDRLQNAYNKGDLVQLRYLLSNENLYPQLAIAHLAMKSICRGAEYIKPQIPDLEDEILNLPIDNYRHYQLNLDYYTHFTSPIRRYTDVVIQRLVNALLSKADIEYTETELQQLCTHLNRKVKAASRFERDMKRVELATSCEESLEQLEVYLTRSHLKEHKFELCVPSCKYSSVVLSEDSTFDLSQLNCFQAKESLITWRVISIPMQSPDFLLTSPLISHFSECSEHNVSNSNPSCIKATVFRIMKEDQEKPAKEQKRQKLSYLASIEDGASKIDLNGWRLANDIVKNICTNDNFDPDPLKKLMLTLLGNTKCTENVHMPSFRQSPVICYDTTRRLDFGETFNVWIGKSIRRPISSPGVHLLEVAPSVKVCLQHNQSPAMCFSDTQLRLTSKFHYHSEHEYVELWCKALLAEASHDGVNTRCLVLFKDVSLKWPELEKPDNCLDNVHFKPVKDLIFEIEEEKLTIIDFIVKIKIRPGDLVCARYATLNLSEDQKSSEALCAVYHFVIQDVKTLKTHSKETDKKKTVHMRPVGQYGCCVFPKWRKILQNDNPSCELQIIKMPDSFK